MTRNLGTVDKLLRVLLALLLTALWYSGFIGGTLAFVLLGLAAVLLVTTTLGVCPFYLPFNVSTNRRQERRSDVNFSALLRQGAAVLDVRSSIEYGLGHLQQSMNFPLEEMTSNLHRLPGKHTPLIICCASGIRSAVAIDELRSLGYTLLYDGGNWLDLRARLREGN